MFILFREVHGVDSEVCRRILLSLTSTGDPVRMCGRGVETR